MLATYWTEDCTIKNHEGGIYSLLLKANNKLKVEYQPRTYIRAVQLINYIWRNHGFWLDLVVSCGERIMTMTSTIIICSLHYLHYLKHCLLSLTGHHLTYFMYIASNAAMIWAPQKHRSMYTRRGYGKILHIANQIHTYIIGQYNPSVRITA